MTALARLTEGGFSIGIEAPLDNDWTLAGEQARRQTGRLPGEFRALGGSQLAG